MSRVLVLGAEEDADAVKSIGSHLREKRHSCKIYILGQMVSPANLLEGVIQDIDRCQYVVCVISAATDSYRSVVASITEAVNLRKQVITIIIDGSKLGPELSLLLAGINYLRVERDVIYNVFSKLDRVFEERVDSPGGQTAPQPWRLVALGVIVVLGVYLIWRMFNPRGADWPDQQIGKILEVGVMGIADDLPPGRLIVSVLGFTSNDYVSRGVAITENDIVPIPNVECEKSFLFDEIDAGYLMEPVLAAIAMRHGNVLPEVALGNDKELLQRYESVNSILNDEVLSWGLSQFNLSKALHGTGVAPMVRRFQARLYSLAQAMRLIAIEALGAVGFDYCGGRQNAQDILKRYSIESWCPNDPVRGTVLSKVTRRTSTGGNCSSVDAIGVLMSRPYCSIVIHFTGVVRTEEEKNLRTAVETIWHVLALSVVADWENRCEKKSL